MFELLEKTPNKGGAITLKYLHGDNWELITKTGTWKGSWEMIEFRMVSVFEMDKKNRHKTAHFGIFGGFLFTK
jgi:hypothetical protein